MNLSSLSQLCFMLTLFYSTITIPMEQEEQTTRSESIRNIIYAVSNKLPPYVRSGKDLARQHVLWEEKNGLRQPSQDIPEYYINTPIPNELYYLCWIQANALYALCKHHDTYNRSHIPLCSLAATCSPVTIEHPGSDNKWFEWQKVTNIFERLRAQGYLTAQSNTRKRR